MDSRLTFCLKGLHLAQPGIWKMDLHNEDQGSELAVRDAVATSALHSDSFDSYWPLIRKHHSVPVMRTLLDRWLQTLPADSVVMDAGVGWGWHWIDALRRHRNICVVAVDFSLESLKVAKQFLPADLASRIALVQGNVMSLEFEDELFDGYWSVQCLQHVPDFEQAVKEAFRILKPGGGFVNWSLNDALLFAAVYSSLGKHYHREGKLESWGFQLNRWSRAQRQTVRKVFAAPVSSSCSEIVFQPDFRAARLAHNALGARIDVALSGTPWSALFAPLARQRSLVTRKPKLVG